jgi:hypothetical protein
VIKLYYKNQKTKWSYSILYIFGTNIIAKNFLILPNLQGAVLVSNLAGSWLVSLRLILSPRKVQALIDSNQIYFFFLHQQSGEHWVWLEFSDMITSSKKFTVYHR